MTNRHDAIVAALRSEFEHYVEEMGRRVIEAGEPPPASTEVQSALDAIVERVAVRFDGMTPHERKAWEEVIAWADARHDQACEGVDRLLPDPAHRAALRALFETDDIDDDDLP